MEARVNDIISNGSAFPWGTNPAMGYQIIDQGPLVCRYRFWMFLKRYSDNAKDKWRRVDIWVDCYSTTNFAVRALVSSCTIYGGLPSGTLGESTQGAYVFTATLTNGSVIQNYGGTSDRRTFSVASTAFTVASQAINLTTASPAFNAISQANQPELASAFTLTSSGSLPAGLSAATPYTYYCADSTTPASARLVRNRW